MVELRLLGPVEIETDEGLPLALGAGRIRTVAAVLISEVNQAVTVQRLIDLAWDGEPPARARGVVHNHVHRLRQLLDGHAELVTRGQGYVLIADPAAVDSHRFRSLVSAARDADPRAAVAMLRRALGLWRGEALADVPGDRVRRTLGVGLAQARVAALQELGAKLLLLGRYGELVTELTAWTAEHPLHEELAALLMRALQANGRQAEALDHYHRTRRHLKEQLGIDPGPALGAAYLEVLGRGPAVPPPAAVRPPAGPPPAGPYAEGPRPAAPPRVAQLPPAVVDFCGRARELAVLEQHLDRVPRPHCLVLAGGGGTGKTSLAVQWAHRLTAEFPDGQLFVDLRGFERPPMRAGTALSAFLRALGVPEAAIPDSVPERAALYRSLLAGRRMLVVLDNAGTAEQTRPLLPATPGRGRPGGSGAADPRRCAAAAGQRAGAAAHRGGQAGRQGTRQVVRRASAGPADRRRAADGPPRVAAGLVDAEAGRRASPAPGAVRARRRSGRGGQPVSDLPRAVERCRPAVPRPRTASGPPGR
ncbi:AfsR/SARP family transcriptional regulator [Streptomyces sp. MOE7]|uniref:AfsR/SARP family transcriptional regulator n=1 Tax=Streptomyces sp. MOE7 TaxID=1961713 RepID=UPI000A07FB94|nr:BTAD domain-containing putative transcriptional regulator [Streptomyces sp. MOE7]ARH91636.1 hypothetical protein STRMOE7_16510 [Streptomyces sp. MOE7]